MDEDDGLRISGWAVSDDLALKVSICIVWDFFLQDVPVSVLGKLTYTSVICFSSPGQGTRDAETDVPICWEPGARKAVLFHARSRSEYRCPPFCLPVHPANSFFLFLKVQKSFYLGKFFSIFTSELYAILMTLNYICNIQLAIYIFF